MSFSALLLMERTQLLGSCTVKSGWILHTNMCVCVCVLTMQPSGRSRDHSVAASITRQRDGPELPYSVGPSAPSWHPRDPSETWITFQTLCPFPSTSGTQRTLIEGRDEQKGWFLFVKNKFWGSTFSASKSPWPWGPCTQRWVFPGANEVQTQTPHLYGPCQGPVPTYALVSL